MILTYKLPATILPSLKNNDYRLAWQKEPGMINPSINLDIAINNQRPLNATGLDNLAHLSQSAVSFNGFLDQDRLIIVHY